MRLKLWAVAICLELTTGTASAAVTGAIAAMRPAVVLVFLAADDLSASGFVVRSDSKGCDILTSLHHASAGSTVETYFEGDLRHPHRGDVVKVDAEHGIVLIHVNEPASAQAALAENNEKGEMVAALGYPDETAVRLAQKGGELKPEAALGTITSTSGATLSTSAYTERGEAGAPIFRQDDAAIVGIVTNDSSQSSYQAVGVTVIRHFLSSAGVAFHGASGTSSGGSKLKYDPLIGMQHLREVRGAGQLLSEVNLQFRLGSEEVANALYSVADQNTMKSFVLTELQVKLADTIRDSFSARLNVPANEAPTDLKGVAQLARDQTGSAYVGALYEIVKIGSEKSKMFQNTYGAAIELELVDLYGDVVYEGFSSKLVKRTNLIPMREEDFEAIVSDVSKAAMADLEASAAKNGDDGGVNFARFGVPLATGQKSAFFSITAESGGARVTGLVPYGTAARARLQVGDLIVALDGEDLSRLTTAEITQRFDHHPSALYRCTVVQPDGHPVVVSFQAEDLRWYSEHWAGVGRK